MSDVRVLITAPPRYDPTWVPREGARPSLYVQVVEDSKIYLEVTLFDVQTNDIRELECSIGRAVLKAGGAL